MFGPIYVIIDDEYAFVEYRFKCLGIEYYKDNEITIEEYHDGILVTVISEKAFENCKKIESITIPSSIKTIGKDTFVGCSNLKNINVDPSNRYYCSIDGNLYSKDGTTLIYYAQGKKEKSFTVPDQVTKIERGAFRDCDSLKEIIFPENLKSIEAYAFQDCDGLESITTPAALQSIGNSAFSNCKSLKYATILNGTILNSTISISDMVFANCSSLEEIFIPSSVEYWGSDITKNCTKLTTVHCYADFGNFGFDGSPFPYVKNLTLGGTTVPSGLNWTNVENIIITGNITVIPEKIFSGCHSLKTLTISSKVTKIEDHAIDYCFSLTDIFYEGSENDWNKITDNIFLNNNQINSNLKTHFEDSESN